MRIISRLPLLVALAALAVTIEAGTSHPRGLLRERQLSSRPADLHRPLGSPGPANNSPDGSESTSNPPTPSSPPNNAINGLGDRPGPSSSADGIDSCTPGPPAPPGPSPPLVIGGAQTDGAGLKSAASSPLWDDGPSVQPDVPITLAFLVLFLAGAAVHGWRCYAINRHTADHTRPVLSALALSFCLLRVVACVLRIVLANQPRDDAAMILEMTTVQTGSVVIFVANIILGQRLLKHFSLTSLLHSSWRLVLFWFSRLLLPVAILSAVTIFALYAAGTGLLASDDSPVGTSGHFEEGLILLKISISWLLVFGAVPVLLVLLVMATSRIVPSRKDSLVIKLTVFLLGAVMLVTGQSFHLGALFDPQLVGGKIVFYVAGFTLELLVVMLYVLANLDILFAGQRPNQFVQARDTPQPRSGAYGPYQKAEVGSTRAYEKPGEGAIVVRKDFEVFVAKLGTTPSGRSSSMTSDGPERIGKSVEKIRGFAEHSTSRPGSRKSPPEPLR